MKTLILIFMILTGTKAFAQLETQVRCKGINSNGHLIGVDLQLDQVNNILEMVTFEQDSTSYVDLESLGNPQVTISIIGGEIKNFALQTFNDGLDTNDNIQFSSGSLNNILELGYRGEVKAIANIECTLL